MFKTTLSLLLLLSCTLLYAQRTHVITGVVLSAETREPLSGASVVLNKSFKGVSTDNSGHFSITSSVAGNLLTVSYVGKETAEIQVHDNDITVLLKATNKILDEVVAVAYTNVKKSGYPGAVATISSDKIDNRQTPNLTNALQGLVTGLQAESANGQPGNSSTIRIRGVGSINASSAPLFVVDGAPYDGDINALNAADIASISVLKDATAANLYGSRAANGVILITTKHGKKSDDVAVNITVNQGWSSRAVKDYAQVNTDQYFQLYWEALRNKQLTNGATPQQAAQYASLRVVSDLGINPYGANFPQPVGADGKIAAGAKPLWDNSWEDAMHQQAKYTQAQLSFSGGGDKGTYYVSGGYVNNDGVYLASGFKRYNVRSNLTLQAKKWLKAGLDVSGASTLQNYPTSSDSKTSNVVLFGRTIPSFYPIYQINPDGTYKLDGKGQRIIDYGDYRPSSALARENLIGTLPLDKSQIQKENASVRTYLEATILSGLKFKTSYNLDYVNQNSHYYTNPLFGDDAAIGGTVSKSNSRLLSYTWNNIITYDHDFASGHHINLLGGHEYYSFNTRNLSGNRQNFVLPGLYEPVAASVLNDFSGNADNYAKLSFFGQGQYNYLNKYYFTASLRTDGSSRFSPDSRWGTFWSAGASWRIAEENFIRQVKWINVLTLKASYGASGNDNLSSYYAYQALYAINNNLGNGGVIASRLPTPDLKWESNLNANIGLDFGIFNNRISGTINYYNRKSKNLLYAQPLAPSTGFSSVNANIGSLRNSGWELELNAVPVNSASFKWSISLNATHNKNVITSLPQKEIISGTKKLMVGKSIYEFYIREWAGVDPKTGDPLWYKTDEQGKRVTTSVYSQATQYYQGSSLPDVYGGFSNTFNYKGVELSFLLAYSLGGKVLDGDYTSMLSGGSSPGHSWGTELLDRWTPDHTQTNVPRVTTDNLNFTSASTRFLYSASYARLKMLSVGYYLPKTVLQKAGISNLKIYATGENLFTLYRHKGMDPEQSIDGTTYFQYPAMRTFSVGIQVGL